MKPRLALLTLDFLPARGGVQRYLFEIAQRLSDYYDIYVITPVGGALPSPVGFDRILLRTQRVKEIWHALRAAGPEITLLGHAHPKLLLAALANRRKYATFAHGNDFLAAQKRWHRPFFNRLLSHSRPVIVHSRAMAARVGRLGIPNAIVIHPGVDEKKLTPGTRTHSGSPTLLTIGRLVRRKGIDTTLRSLPKLLEQFPSLTYRIGGEGPDRPRLETVTADLGIWDAVDFLGQVDEGMLATVYREADIFVMPVREEAASIEGFGMVFLEASACGLPIVAGRSGGASEAVREGVTGLLVEPNEPDLLAHAIAGLLNDPCRCRQMGEAGRRWVEAEMNWDRAAVQIVEALS